MVIIEIAKSNTDVIEELENIFHEYEYFEENSFLGNELISFVVPIATALAASPVLIKWIESDKLTIKYNHIEITGKSKQVLKALQELQKKEYED